MLQPDAFWRILFGAISISYTQQRVTTLSVSKACGRCQSAINCMALSEKSCACKEINLNKATLEFLKKTNYDCLCNKCLHELDQLVSKSLHYTFPLQRNKMIEGIHYYIEHGYFVFTELYHITRGYCCKSGCRHCAYGYKNE
jgi:hypothetical protein